VFDQTLSVGALIAFQMLSGRVTQPLISIVGLVNEYQETALSVRMLGEVMNRAPEGRAGAGGLRPVLQGEIRFDDVTFRYPGAQTMRWTAPASPSSRAPWSASSAAAVPARPR
jgi:subfamily B ATP-binding cassette protein HlyB/CyaB